MREKLIELLCKAHNAITDKSLENDSKFGMTYAEQIETEADSLIASGVTIPVRCKDCLHYHGVTGKDSGKPCGYGWCEHRNGTKRVCYDDEFCSYGERRSDD